MHTMQIHTDKQDYGAPRRSIVINIYSSIIELKYIGTLDFLVPDKCEWPSIQCFQLMCD